MRIDYEYLKNILEIILDNDHPDFRIDHPRIKPLWINDAEEKSKLIFHMEILADQGLVEAAIPSQSGLGFRRSGDGGFAISVIPLRLTSKGHQFAADLSKPGVFELLATKFKELGPGEGIKAVFKVGTKIAESQIDSMLKDIDL